MHVGARIHGYPKFKLMNVHMMCTCMGCVSFHTSGKWLMQTAYR